MSPFNFVASRQNSTSSNDDSLIKLIEALQEIVSQAQQQLYGGDKAGTDRDQGSRDGEGETKQEGDATLPAAPAAPAAESRRTSDVVAKLSNICGKLQSLVGKTRSHKEKEGDRGEHIVDSFYDSSTRISQIDKLNNNLHQIKARLNTFEEEFRDKVKDHTKFIEQILPNLKFIVSSDGPSSLSSASAPKKSVDDQRKTLVDQKFREINAEMTKLMYRIPSSSSSKLDSGAAAAHLDKSQKRRDVGTSTSVELDKLLSALPETDCFLDSSVYKEVRDYYEELGEKEKKGLLSFAVFSENEELKKMMLTYWWEGEEFLTADNDKNIEDAAGEILKKFEDKRLIKPIYKKRRSTASAYRMEPVVRSAIVKVADEVGEFSYNINGNLAAKFNGGNMAAVPVKKTPSRKKSTDDQSNRSSVEARRENAVTQPTATADQKASDQSKQQSKEKQWNQEKLETIFNVKEEFPDLRMKALAMAGDESLTTEEWLLKIKALKVLYLGNWRVSGKHHIEVDSMEFLKGLRNMKSLRLLSLRGISRINELTNSIKGLKDLRILDLKACHNLEELPKEISYLQNLTHLNVSDCYLIDHMPRGLSFLTNLQVLKGFVLGDYLHQTGRFCTLENLAGMKKLRKLSIITSKNTFPTDSELKALQNLHELQKLTLLWGADSTQKEINDRNQPSDHQGELKQKNPNIKESSLETQKTLKRRDSLVINPPPWNLEKLDLQCYPKATTPSWLNPGKLPELKNLYIRGGRLRDDLGLSKEFEWRNIETLRLKFLAGLKMNWEEMRKMFPNLIYLERVDCPLITLCPCDEEGVWVEREPEESRKEA